MVNDFAPKKKKKKWTEKKKKEQNQKLVEQQQNGNKNSRNCRRERNINRNDDEGKIGYKLLCCTLCTYTSADGFPWGGMMMLSEKKAHTIKIPNPMSKKKHTPPLNKLSLPLSQNSSTSLFVFPLRIRYSGCRKQHVVDVFFSKSIPSDFRRYSLK